MHLLSDLLLISFENFDFLEKIYKILSNYKEIILISYEIKNKELKREIIGKLSFAKKIEFIELKEYETISLFLSDLINKLNKREIDIFLEGSNLVNYFLFFLGALDLIKVNNFIFMVNNDILIQKNIIKLNILSLLDYDDIKIIKNLDYKSSTKRKYLLSYLDESSRAKIDKSLRKLNELGIIERINIGEYKLTELGYILKLII